MQLNLFLLLILFHFTWTAKITSQNYFDVNIDTQGVMPSTNQFPGNPKREEGVDCPCGSPGCPNCILAKTERLIHEQALKHARAETKTQIQLVKEADIQHRLFALAEKYTQELKEDEDKARDLSLELQQVTSHAQTLRNKILKAEYEAKQIAMKAVQTMTLDAQYTEHSGQKYPGVNVQNAGFDQTTIKEYVPQYQIKIGETDGSGYQDLYQQGVYSDAGLTTVGKHMSDEQLDDLDSLKESN